MASVGACCLVGVICQQTLYIANLGDSRCVVGKKMGNTGGIAAIQLSTEHIANIEAVRQELKESHLDDPQIVVLKHGVWRVKGIIPVPVAAAVYYEDMFVNFKIAMETASNIAGIRLWVTNEYMHSGQRDGADRVLDHLLGMLNGRKPLF